MSLLLDTQAFVWWWGGNRKLGRRARARIEGHASAVRVSAASAWEIAIKHRRGQFTMRDPLHVWLPLAIETSGFALLTITIDHAMAVAGLPEHHHDPFDRMLIVQAQLEKLTIVTSDTAFEAYDVTLLDARR